MSARILVIEDNPVSLELMTYLLESWGHSTVGAQNGVEGRRAAHEERPDVMLCDILLPDCVGYDLARTFKGDPALRNIPLVAVTALAMVGDREKAMKVGFDGYIAKPIDPETFVRQVEAFLAPKLRGRKRSPEAER